jgi:hypothetical protein
MSPIEYPVEAFGSLWELLSCSVTMIVATLAFLLSPR